MDETRTERQKIKMTRSRKVKLKLKKNRKKLKKSIQKRPPITEAK